MDEETDDPTALMEECTKEPVSKMFEDNGDPVSTVDQQEEEIMESEGGEKAENPNLLYQTEIEKSGNKTSGRVEEKAELCRRDITLRDATPHRLNTETESNKVEEGKGPSPIKTSKPFDLYPNVSYYSKSGFKKCLLLIIECRVIYH